MLKYWFVNTKIETLYRTSQGFFPESIIKKDLQLATDRELEPIGLVSLRRKIPGSPWNSTSNLILNEN